MLTREDIEKQLEIEWAILGTLRDGSYEEKRETRIHRYQPAPGQAWNHDPLPGYEYYPVYPSWTETVRMRIGALMLILDRLGGSSQTFLPKHDGTKYVERT